MNIINLLDEITIDKIAAGEVVERPLNVVKELCENAIDSGANSITVEIKNGGIKLIRVTDNGCGIHKSQIKKAFLRHATSKIVSSDDLLGITSLGFRGEALSSISAVSCVDMISKMPDELMGIKYTIEGSKEIELIDIGAPDGTTVLVKDLFFNVPARRKFLKSEQTEGAYVNDMLEHLALSHPDISITFINNNKTIFVTSGNGDLKEVVYRIYGKGISDSLIPFEMDNEYIRAIGFIGKPEINRSNRNFENYFINGRYIRCKEINNAVEEGYKNFLMQHKFPFVIIHFEIDPSFIDVNVHPQKMEVKLSCADRIYEPIVCKIRSTISEYELIPQVSLVKESNTKEEIKAPEPFENNRRIAAAMVSNNHSNILNKSNSTTKSVLSFKRPSIDAEDTKSDFLDNNIKSVKVDTEKSDISDISEISKISEIPDNFNTENIAQLNLFDEKFLSEESKEEYTILGQIFKTYWLIAFKDKLFMMDQHAAHEKVNYERFVKRLRDKDICSQQINPPCIIDLSAKEANVINENLEYFQRMGFEIEDFGLGSIAVRAFPVDLYGCNENEFFRELLDELMENPLKGDSEVVLNKLASMSCKAAVKGNMSMSFKEVEALLDELLTLDNPYNCPHGRPTIVSMSKNEIDKKFKRILT